LEKIPLLNGLRGLAIIGVVFHHSFFPQLLYKGDGLPALIGSSGWLGVNVFFFLSGFVLYLPYADGRRNFGDRGALSKFYTTRASRLLPLYYVSTGLLLLFLSPVKPDVPGFYWSALDLLLATHVFREATFFPAVNAALWSLGVEIWFSVLFPLVALAIRRFGWRRMVLYVMLLSLAVRLFGRLYFFSATNPASVFVSQSVFGRLDEFLLGMFGAWLYANKKFTARPLLQIAAGMLLTLCAMQLWSLTYRSHIPRLVSDFANPAFDVGLLLSVNGLLLGGGRLKDALSVWPLQMLGLMCYSVYIWHLPLLSRFGQRAVWPSLSYAAYLALVLAMSWLSYRYIEFRHAARWRDLMPAPRPLPPELSRPVADSQGSVPR
jgi:peptidoglycan/LPS O-acetylase OafA/YrhL